MMIGIMGYCMRYKKSLGQREGRGGEVTSVMIVIIGELTCALWDIA